MWCQTIKLNAYHFVAPVNNAREKRQRGYNPLTPPDYSPIRNDSADHSYTFGRADIPSHSQHRLFGPLSSHLLFFSRESCHVTQTQNAWHTVNITKQ